MTQENQNKNTQGAGNKSGQTQNQDNRIKQPLPETDEAEKALPAEELPEEEMSVDEIFEDDDIEGLTEEDLTEEDLFGEDFEDIPQEDLDLTDENLFTDVETEGDIPEDETLYQEDTSDIELGQIPDEAELSDEDLKFADSMEEDVLTEDDLKGKYIGTDATDTSIDDEKPDTAFDQKELNPEDNELEEDVFADIFSNDLDANAELDEQEKKILELQDTFEKTCDEIQKDTDTKLSNIDPNDTVKQKEILDTHEEKLKKALETLESELDKISYAQFPDNADETTEEAVIDKNIKKTA